MKRLVFVFIAFMVMIAGCDNGVRDELINGVDSGNVNDEQTTNDNTVVPDNNVTPDNTVNPDNTVVPDDNVTPVSVSMTVSVTTSSYGGEFSPKNVFAVWIEKDDGSYVQSLGAWAKSYKSRLQRWYSKSSKGSQGMADAVTGASRTNHNDVPDLTWTISDIANQPAANGIYNIYFELNETNGGSRTTTAQIQMSETPQVLSTNNASNIKNIQITFGN
jgi:hypothetical protein